MSPGQLCNKLLHNCFLRPSLSQSPHVLQASRAEPLDARKLILAIMGQPVDHPRSPTLGSLPGEDIAANRPIEEHQLAIDRECSPNLGGMNASFELLEELLIAGGYGCETEGKDSRSVAWSIAYPIALYPLNLRSYILASIRTPLSM